MSVAFACAVLSETLSGMESFRAGMGGLAGLAGGAAERSVGAGLAAFRSGGAFRLLSGLLENIRVSLCLTDDLSGGFGVPSRPGLRVPLAGG